MNFIPQSIISLGPIVLLVALGSLPFFYARYRKAPEPKKMLSAAQYLFAVFVFGMLGFFAGTYIGISVACEQENAGNLCGLVGFFGVGPLFSGLVLALAAHVLTHRARLSPYP